MKLEFSKRVGLSEKQVSGWFCHRRQKEKKLLQGQLKSTGKPNLSSSAIHDGISGIRQESCSSTKQADRNLDSKEVESKMLYGHDSPSVMFECQASNQHAYLRDYHVSDNRSSGSSSASMKRFVQKAENIHVTHTSSYSIWGDGSILMSNTNTSGDSNRHPVNSRYPFLQDESEIHAISAVKRKLGRQYREDGPQLAVEFDPLPPDAFDSPIQDSYCDQYYIGNSARQEASSMYGSIKEPTMYNRYRLQEPAINSCPEQRGFGRTKQRFNDCNEIKKLQATRGTFISSHTDHFRSQTFAADMDEDFARGAAFFNGRKCLRKLDYTMQGEHDKNAGHHSHKSDPESNLENTSFPNYETQEFQKEQYFDTTPSKKNKIRMEDQPDITLETKKKSGKVNDLESCQQHRAMKGFKKPQQQSQYIRFLGEMGSNPSENISEDTSLSVH